MAANSFFTCQNITINITLVHMWGLSRPTITTHYCTEYFKESVYIKKKKFNDQSTLPFPVDMQPILIKRYIFRLTLCNSWLGCFFYDRWSPATMSIITSYHSVSRWASGQSTLTGVQVHQSTRKWSSPYLMLYLTSGQIGLSGAAYLRSELIVHFDFISPTMWGELCGEV